MANFNKVLLIGRLTRDPQLSYLPSQTAVVDFGLAVNRRWTGRDGEKKEETCFVDCTAFGRQAENINKYMRKGRQLFVEGRLNFSSWTTQDGTKRSRLKVTVENSQFLDQPSADTAGAGAAARAMEQDADRAEPQVVLGTPDGEQQIEQETSADDIPF